MSDDSTRQATAAKVELCPACGSTDVETTTKGILTGEVDTNRAKCGACSWEGIVGDLLTQKFSHEMGSDEQILKAMATDLRNILAEDFSMSFGRFLMKWGFISEGVTPQVLSRYVVAIARATLEAIVIERRKIEQEKA